MVIYYVFLLKLLEAYGKLSAERPFAGGGGRDLFVLENRRWQRNQKSFIYLNLAVDYCLVWLMALRRGLPPPERRRPAFRDRIQFLWRFRRFEDLFQRSLCLRYAASRRRNNKPGRGESKIHVSFDLLFREKLLNEAFLPNPRQNQRTAVKLIKWINFAQCSQCSLKFHFPSQLAE